MKAKDWRRKFQDPASKELDQMTRDATRQRVLMRTKPESVGTPAGIIEMVKTRNGKPTSFHVEKGHLDEIRRLCAAEGMTIEESNFEPHSSRGYITVRIPNADEAP